jgi:hypothetical protein
MTEKQKAIILSAHQNDGQITKAEAVQLIGGYYYHNADKYVGEVLARLVKTRVLNRIQRGVYELARLDKAALPMSEADKRQLVIQF